MVIRYVVFQIQIKYKPPIQKKDTKFARQKSTQKIINDKFNSRRVCK